MTPQKEPWKITREQRSKDVILADIEIDTPEWQRVIDLTPKEIATWRVTNVSTTTAQLRIAFSKDEPHPILIDQGESSTWDTDLDILWAQRGHTVTTRANLEFWHY